jgi:hypothetical protein
MDHSEQRLIQVMSYYRRAKLYFLLQSLILFLCCLYIGLVLLATLRWLGVVMLVVAGVFLCSYAVRLVLLRYHLLVRSMQESLAQAIQDEPRP